MPISLIANTGIQFHKTQIQFNWNDNVFRTRFHFHQYFDTDAQRLSLEVAQQFMDDVTGNDIYVSKYDLKRKGLLNANDAYVGVWNNDADIQHFPNSEIIEVGTNTLRRPIFHGGVPVLAKFFGQWLPFPCFERDMNGVLLDGPYNWARIMVLPEGFDVDPAKYGYDNPQQNWNIIIAFDTTSIFDDGNYNNQFRETPLFANRFETTKTFGMPVTDMKLMNFVAPPEGNCDWINDGIMKLVHGTIDITTLYNTFLQNGWNNGNGIPPVYTYLASYLYFLYIIASRLNNADVSLINAANQPAIDVDLVVDMGNSKTTAVLFERGCFDKVDMVELQDFSHPCQVEDSPFDMDVVFSRADFGICNIANSSQFIHPSIVRLGREASYLRQQAGLGGNEKLSSGSSPKRYLWDKQRSRCEWQYIRHGDNESEPIELRGITNQFNSDGTLSLNGYAGGEARYSRRSLMTFAFLEILAQAFRQINSQKYREAKGNDANARRISKILVTCPTAMSRVEQIELRKAAAEAYVVLNRYYNHTDNTQLDYNVAVNAAPVKPSLRDLRPNSNNPIWYYDEATCVQYVYLCAEVAERYGNNCAEFFRHYGKLRSGFLDEAGNPYSRESLTIGSIDIGAGTTDVMICSYKYATVGQTTLTPVPRYWESFYIAGDDILKALIQELVIEGGDSMVETQLRSQGNLSPQQISTLITDFFGENSNRMDFPARQIRREFCRQISVPVAQCFMECTRRNISQKELSWDDIFQGIDKPNDGLLKEFYDHFGFHIEEQVWHYSIGVTTRIINNVMDELIKKISTALTEYGCDIVLLAGRPCSLKPIEDLFLKYYPVDPTRLKVLNEYRVGRWYPFQDGNGYFENQKSVVAVGALVGYICSELGGYKELSIHLGELGEKMLPTTKYIGLMSDNNLSLIPPVDILLNPQNNTKDFKVPSIPIRIGCRQLDAAPYPARPLYTLDFDDDAIRRDVVKYLQQQGLPTDIPALIQLNVDDRKNRFRQRMPVTLVLDRDYAADRERVVIIDMWDRDGNVVNKNYLSLQIKSLRESDAFWMDSGEFRCGIAAKVVVP